MGLKSTFLTGGGRAWPYVLPNPSKVVVEEEEEAWLMIHAASWPGKAPRGHSETPAFGTVTPS